MPYPARKRSLTTCFKETFPEAVSWSNRSATSPSSVRVVLTNLCVTSDIFDVKTSKKLLLFHEKGKLIIPLFGIMILIAEIGLTS